MFEVHRFIYREEMQFVFHLPRIVQTIVKSDDHFNYTLFHKSFYPDGTDSGIYKEDAAHSNMSSEELLHWLIGKFQSALNSNELTPHQKQWLDNVGRPEDVP